MARELIGGCGQLPFGLLPGEHPIVPVMVGDEVTAGRFSERLVELGVYAVSFSFPVVPRGTARIRTQMWSRSESCHRGSSRGPMSIDGHL